MSSPPIYSLTEDCCTRSVDKSSVAKKQSYHHTVRKINSVWKKWVLAGFITLLGGAFTIALSCHQISDLTELASLTKEQQSLLDLANTMKYVGIGEEFLGAIFLGVAYYKKYN